MKTPGHNIDFLIDPEIVSEIDLINDYNSASKLILNLITSKFPTGSFSYANAKAGKPPSLACNPYPTTKGDIQVCLFVLREKHENGWLQGGILTWLHPPSSFFRPRYKPHEIDFQLVADLGTKLEAIFIDHLHAQNVIIRKKAVPS